MSTIAENVLTVDSVSPATSGEGSFRYIDISSIDREDKVIISAASIENTNAPSRARQLVRAGDVLVSTVRPNLNAVAVVPPELDGAIASTGFTVLRPNPGKLASRFLFNWVRSETFVDEMTRLATGASYPAVSDKIIKASTIPLPPLEEQRRIAEVLDLADALRQKRRLALQKLDTLVQSVFLEMFGDLTRNSKDWEEARFLEICDRLTVGVVVKPASYYVPVGVPALRSLNIKPGRVDESELVFFSQEVNDTTLAKSRLRSGDVVIVRTGKPGTAAVVPQHLHGANAIDLLIVTPKAERISSIYMTNLLNSAFGAGSVAGSKRGQIQQHFNVGSLREMKIPLPPLNVQERFEQASQKIAAARRRLIDSQESIEAMFRSIQTRAFVSNAN